MQTDKTPEKTLYVQRGAPRKIKLRYRAETGGALIAFTAAVVVRITHPAGSFDLTVGSGITLATAESVANGEATLELTIAQSELVPVGQLSYYEVQDVEDGDEIIVVKGPLIGLAGRNPNA